MSSLIHKYHIHYDGNDGYTYHKYIYCKEFHSCDSQKWSNEDGSSLNFDFVTDSHAFVLACCIAGIKIDDKDFYWEEVEIDSLPQVVEKSLTI